MSTLLDQLRTEFENLKARAANAEARATAAEEELKRYQRADVGERVREYAHDHEQDTRDIPRLGIGAGGWPVKLRAPFPWFGGKSRAAELIWSRLGEVSNYVLQ